MKHTKKYWNCWFLLGKKFPRTFLTPSGILLPQVPLQHSPPVQQPPMVAIGKTDGHPNQSGQRIGQTDQFNIPNKGGHHPEGSRVEDQRNKATIVQFHLVPAIIQLQQFAKFSIYATIEQVGQCQQWCVERHEEECVLDAGFVRRPTVDQKLRQESEWLKMSFSYT